MISNLFVRLFGKIVNFLSITGSIPFYMDSSKNLLLVSEQKHQNKALQISRIITFSYSIYSGIRLAAEMQSFLQDYIGLLIVGVWTPVYMWAFILQVCHRIKQSEMAWMFNQIVHTNQIFQSKLIFSVWNWFSYCNCFQYQTYFEYFVETSVGVKSTRLLEAMVIIYTYMEVVATIIWTSVFYFASSKKGYVYSLVSEQHQFFVLFSVFLAFEIFTKFQTCAIIIWDLLFFGVTTIVSNYWTNQVLYDKYYVFYLKQ